MLMFRAGRGEGDGHVVLRDQRPHILRGERGVRERDPRCALLAADPEVLDDQPAESAESSPPGDTAGCFISSFAKLNAKFISTHNAFSSRA